MQVTIKKFLGFSLAAADGEIGKVKDVYFDDHNWVIRYLVVETGNWFVMKSVLISPSAVISAPDAESRTIPVALTKEQIKHSPEIDTDLPVSRQQEASLMDYYAWPAYGSIATMYPTVGMVEEASSLEKKQVDTEKYDPHLRSFKHVSQYQVHNPNGLVGSVEDLILDLRNWRISDLVLSRNPEMEQGNILIPAEKITNIDLSNYRVNTELTSAEMITKTDI